MRVHAIPADYAMYGSCERIDIYRSIGIGMNSRPYEASENLLKLSIERFEATG